MIANADGSQAHKLADLPGSNGYGNYVVRWSPDGRRIAALDKTVPDPGGLNVSLIEVDVATGAKKPMAGRRFRDVFDFTWLPDGSGLLLAALNKTGEESQLWLVSYPSGATRRISNDLSAYLSVAISGDGHTVAATQQTSTSNIWVGNAKTPDELRQVTTGRLDGKLGVVFSPDDHLFYVGNHSQNWDIFVSDIDGSNARQVAFDDRYHQSVAVCDQGRSIVYSSDYKGFAQVWKLNPQSGVTTKMTDRAGSMLPTCGGRGDQVFYMAQDPDGASRIFKIPIAGGAAVRFSDQITVSPPFASLDGEHIVFAALQKNGGVRGEVASASTGAHESELNIPATFDASTHAICWMPDNRSMAFSDLRTGAPNLWAINVFDHVSEKQLTHFTSGTIWSCAYSPNGKWLAVARGSNASDVVLFNSGK